MFGVLRLLREDKLLICNVALGRWQAPRFIFNVTVRELLIPGVVVLLSSVVAFFLGSVFILFVIRLFIRWLIVFSWLTSENFYPVLSIVTWVNLFLVLEVGVLDLAELLFKFFSIYLCLLSVLVIPPLPLLPLTFSLLFISGLPLILVTRMRHTAFGVFLVSMTIEVLVHVWL